jgi:hypothetical protein
MKNTRISSAIISLLFLIFISTFSAFADDLQKTLEESSFTDSIGAEAISGDFGGKPLSLSGAAGEAVGRAGTTDPVLLQELRRAYEKGISSAETTTTGDVQQKTPRIVLKDEAGDGLAALSWTVANLPQKAADAPLKYTIFYGMESGQPIRKIEVGTATSYKLRGLRNNHVYYVQILGLSKDKQVLLSSGEERLTPLGR